ncbi:MAG: YidC/Oxa1 family membrane protein insertase [Defluviitaleaceae bacterium]|nr:YidC/Oxa1 family membrane protein insertase [Defluviitaleaceae bacterium]
MKFDMNKKMILGLAVVAVLLVLTGCGVQVDPERALTAETASGFWESFLVLPLIQMITWLYNLLGNLGVAIIVATILTKAAVMPLMLKSMNNTAKMQTIQPEQDKIKQRYAGKTDRDSQMKMQTEMQALYKEKGISPLAGCLPMLIQMPLMFAFFQAFSRHPLIATTDVRYFLGMSLSAVSEVPNVIFAAVVAGLMYFSQTMTQKKTQSSEANAQVANSMKMMNVMFLPMMALMVYSSPLAMGLYFIVSQLMMTVQSLIIKKPGGTPTPF